MKFSERKSEICTSTSTLNSLKYGILLLSILTKNTRQPGTATHTTVASSLTFLYCIFLYCTFLHCTFLAAGGNGRGAKTVSVPDAIHHALTLVEECRDNRGTVFTTGVGKSGLVASRMAASLRSIGVPSQYVERDGGG